MPPPLFAVAGGLLGLAQGAFGGSKNKQKRMEEVYNPMALGQQLQGCFMVPAIDRLVDRYAAQYIVIGVQQPLPVLELVDSVFISVGFQALSGA